MKRLPVSLLFAASMAALAACGGPAPGGPGGPGAPGAGIDPASINTPYAAIAAGKVDIEGGLVDVAARAPGIVREVLVQEGDKVVEGQCWPPGKTMTRASRATVAAQLSQAEAQLPILEVQPTAIREERLKRLTELTPLQA
jgi:HlyD family secretion protein